MDGLGDIIYILIFVLITIFGAVSKNKEKKNKKVVKQQSVLDNPAPSFNTQTVTNNESDVLMDELSEKLKQEEKQRLDEERAQLKEVSDILNTPKEVSEVKIKAEQIKHEDEKEELIIEELEDDVRGINYDLNFNDVDQVRKAFISAEILNKKY